jgi:dienelactone hydrolase
MEFLITTTIGGTKERLMKEKNNCVIGEKRAVIIIPEIYGINQYIDHWANYFSQRGYDVFCIDLYGKRKYFHYFQETVAYDYFKAFIGFEVSDNLEGFMKSKRAYYDKLILFGSSVGATIAWKLTENCNCDGMIGYYGGRIRDYLKITPRCSCLLIFPEQEKTFNASAVSFNLNKTKMVQSVVLSGEHGFGDPFGRNFNFQSGKKAFNMVKCFLDEIEQSEDSN